MSAGAVFRIKVKHLLLILVILLGSGVAVVKANPGILYSMAEKAQGSGEREKALVYFDRYLEKYPGGDKVPEALYKSALAMDPQEDGWGYVFSNGSRAVPQIQKPKDVAGAEDRYRRLITEFPGHRLSSQAEEKLIRLLIREGRYAEAKAEINQALTEEDREWIQADLTRYLIDIAFQSGYYQQVIDLALDYQSKWRQFGGFQILLSLGDAYLRLGQFDEAVRWYDEADRFQEEQRGRMAADVHFTDEEGVQLAIPSARGEHDAMVSFFSQSQGRGSVTGQVTGEDGPWANVDVILGPASLLGNEIPPDPATYFTARTDEQGRFTFADVAAGEYTLGLKFPGGSVSTPPAYVGPKPLVVEVEKSVEAGFRTTQAIKPLGADGFVHQEGDTIRVAWQKVPGAKYYVINMGGRGAYGPVDHVTENEVSLDWFTLRGSSLFHAYGSEGIWPQGLLGMAYPGGEHVVYIKAYDDKGMIATSETASMESSQALFTVGSKEDLSKGERLVLQRQYNEAIDELQAQLAKDPHDLTAAMVLFRIYAIGTDMKRTHADTEKARALGEALLKEPLPEKVAQTVQALLPK